MHKILLAIFIVSIVHFSGYSQFNNSDQNNINKSTKKSSPKKYIRLYPDSANNALCISLQAGLQSPTGNLFNRFGGTKSAGIAIYHKSKSNICIGVTGEYFFGKKVKESNLFKNISTSDGNIITADGDYAEIRLYERGYFLGPTFGYISKFISKNKNSGLSFWLSVGFFEHRIKILGDNVLQLSSDYKTGYDRLTNGVGLQPGVFYYHMSRNHLVNYRIGVEFLAGFTQGQRNINFDTGLSGRDKRFDGMINFKACWFLPKFFYGGNREFTY